MGVGPTSWHTWRPPTPRSVPWSRWAAPPRCKVGPGPCLRRRQRRHWAMSTAALDQIVITTFVIRGFISLQSILLLPAAAAVVDRPRLLEFFLRMCVPPERGGGMTMHEGEGARDCVGRRCVLLLVFLCCSRNRTRGVPPPPPPHTHTCGRRRGRGGCAGLLLRPGSLRDAVPRQVCAGRRRWPRGLHSALPGVAGGMGRIAGDAAATSALHDSRVCPSLSCWPARLPAPPHARRATRAASAASRATRPTVATPFVAWRRQRCWGR